MKSNQPKPDGRNQTGKRWSTPTLEPISPDSRRALEALARLNAQERT